jgi:translation initiation factor IF-2
MNNAKVRIYDLSKELNLENRDILDICEQLNIAVKSHSSTISESDAERIRAAAPKFSPSSAHHQQPKQPKAPEKAEHKQQILAIHHKQNRPTAPSPQRPTPRPVLQSPKSPTAPLAPPTKPVNANNVKVRPPQAEELTANIETLEAEKTSSVASPPVAPVPDLQGPPTRQVAAPPAAKAPPCTSFSRSP